MPQPTTPFESDGQSLTPLEVETAFWQQVAADTSATLTTAGLSSGGRTIHRIDLGTGTDRTMFITSLIHGSEPATREALLLWLRDLAYSTDPAVVNYLASHRIVALTPCNPDGFLTGDRHVPGVGDPNRDFFRLAFQETRVIMSHFAQVRPHLTVDIHEFLGGPTNTYDYWGYPSGNPWAPQGIKDAAQDIFDLTIADLKGAGYAMSDYYPWSGIMRAGMSTAPAVMHSVPMLHETNAFQPLTRRVAVMRIALDRARERHETNAHLYTQVVEASRELARSSTAPLPIYTGEYFEAEPNPLTVRVSGYQLAPGQVIPAHQVSLHQIKVQPDGFVPIQQEAQWVLPGLCDPASPDRVVEASRVAPKPYRGNPVGAILHSRVVGRRQVVAAFHDTGGERRRLHLPGL